MKYDALILGAGPAGLTSALYLARANKTVAVIGRFGGGEAGKIAVIENYPGIEKTDGVSLLLTMKKQAKDAGAVFFDEIAMTVDCVAKTVRTAKNVYEGKTLILASGCSAQKLGIDREKELIGRGISYCASCDGPLFKGREVALTGSGKKAENDVLYLSNVAKKVYYITDDDFSAPSVQTVKSEVVGLVGDPLEKILLDNGMALDVPVLFVNIGYLPESALFSRQVQTDDNGFVVTDENCRTNIDGVYAVGDIRANSFRQIVTACASGAIASYDVIKRKV